MNITKKQKIESNKGKVSMNTNAKYPIINNNNNKGKKDNYNQTSSTFDNNSSTQSSNHKRKQSQSSSEISMARKDYSNESNLPKLPSNYTPNHLIDLYQTDNFNFEGVNSSNNSLQNSIIDSTHFTEEDSDSDSEDEHDNQELSSDDFIDKFHLDYSNYDSIHHALQDYYKESYKAAKKLYTETEFEAIQTRVANVKIPSGFMLFKQPKGKSYIWAVGVAYFKNKDEIYYQCCCDSSCYNNRSLSIGWDECMKAPVTSSINKHISRKHNKLSDKSKVQKAKAIAKSLRNNQTLLINSEVEKQRSYRLRVAKVIALNALSLRLVESESFNELQMTNEGYVELSSYQITHTIVELYQTALDHIKGYIQATYEYYNEQPFLHITVDNWTSKVNNRKYISARIYFVDKNGNRHSYNLGIKLIRPARNLLSTEKATLLLSWLQHILSGVGATMQMINSSTTDAGTDIKKCLNKLLKKFNPSASWDHCLPHLLNLVLLNGMGTNQNKRQSKNLTMRARVKSFKSEIKKIKNSPTLQRTFEDILEDLLNEANDDEETKKIDKVLKNDVSQRWRSTIDMIERGLLHWEAIKRVRNESGEVIDFKYDDKNKEIYIQIYSLIYPLQVIQKLSQGDKKYIPTCLIYTLLAGLKNITLNKDSNLPRFDPSDVEIDRGSLVTTMFNTEDGRPQFALEELHDDVKQARDLISKALINKFYKRYWDVDAVDRSWCLDISLALHPLTKEMDNFVTDMVEFYPEDKYTKEELRDKIIKETWKRIETLAYNVNKNDYQNNIINKNTTETPSSNVASMLINQRKPNDIHESIRNSFGHWFYKSSDNNSNGTVTTDTLIQLVKQEKSSYQSLGTPTDCQIIDPIGWYIIHRNNFPLLFKTAMHVFAFTISSASLEVDFGLVSLVMTPKRNRLRASLFDAMCTIFINRHLDTYKNYNNIKTLKKHEVNAILKYLFNGAVTTFPLMEGEVNNPKLHKKKRKASNERVSNEAVSTEVVLDEEVIKEYEDDILSSDYDSDEIEEIDENKYKQSLLKDYCIVEDTFLNEINDFSDEEQKILHLKKKRKTKK